MNKIVTDFDKDYMYINISYLSILIIRAKESGSDKQAIVFAAYPRRRLHHKPLIPNHVTGWSTNQASFYCTIKNVTVVRYDMISPN